MIVLTRVDHRLLHGQVVFAWLRSVGADCVLVADDAVAGDQLRMSALRLAKPDGLKLVIKSIDDSASAIAKGATDKYKLLVICASVEGACRLAEQVPAITEIDLGGVKQEPGKRQLSEAVFLSDTEIDLLRQAEKRGVRVYAQMLPTDTQIDLSKLV
jgi:fructoselysine and glucoselysine-specific PTS system IIB component